MKRINKISPKETCHYERVTRLTPHYSVMKRAPLECKGVKKIQNSPEKRRSAEV